jgi:hypothetical protein
MPINARSDAVYCSDRCRMRAARRIQRQRNKRRTDLSVTPLPDIPVRANIIPSYVQPDPAAVKALIDQIPDDFSIPWFLLRKSSNA